MSQGSPTLNSRLRVLVAKTFRAEKLYSSMRCAGDGVAASSTALVKIANDVRAKEWQVMHSELRAALNELIRVGNSSRVADELEVLYEQYYARFIESTAVLDRGVSALIETSRKQEFAQLLKISAEMIRHKARAQACKVIADELLALLDSVGRGRKSENLAGAFEMFSSDSDVDRTQAWERLSADPSEIEVSKQPVVPHEYGSKIIPLTRRRSSDKSSPRGA